MLQLISKETLEPNNIPLTLTTELAKLKNCDSTMGNIYIKILWTFGWFSTELVMQLD